MCRSHTSCSFNFCNILMENYESEEIIRQGLERKLDTMVNRELYSKYKTAPTEEEREKSRQEYLDRRGIPENFRW